MLNYFKKHLQNSRKKNVLRQIHGDNSNVLGLSHVLGLLFLITNLIGLRKNNFKWEKKKSMAFKIKCSKSR